MTAWSSSPVRNPLSQSGNASSNLVQAICPHCKEWFDDEVFASPGDFTVCVSCRAIVRFNSRLQLRILEEDDWIYLDQHKEMFVDMLRWRMNILVDQLKGGHDVGDI